MLPVLGSILATSELKKMFDKNIETNIVFRRNYIILLSFLNELRITRTAVMPK